MDSVLKSIRSSFVPIRREGVPFIAAFAVATVLLGWLWQPLLWIGLVLTAWCAYFFRDPPRVTPQDADLVMSPADGIVSAIGMAMPPLELDLGAAPMTRISVFMNVFNCHVNRMPVAGRVERIAYRRGKFINADLDKASEDNERNAVLIETTHGPVVVVQIAGLVARRILCWAVEGQQLAAGERFGMIRFGSRLDVYLPAGSTVRVAVGQTAIAGETILAQFGVNRAGWSVRVD